MRAITVHRLSLQFDADQVTQGTPEEQADQAIALINQSLQREPFGLAAQIIATRDEIEVQIESAACENCGGKGWLDCNTGNDQSPRHEIQRCDSCERYGADQDARKAAQKGEPSN